LICVTDGSVGSKCNVFFYHASGYICTIRTKRLHYLLSIYFSN